jgi:hypothetical protein
VFLPGRKLSSTTRETSFFYLTKLFSWLENIFSWLDNLFSKLGYLFSSFENSFIHRKKEFYPLA